jgi:hypothetical protein
MTTAESISGANPNIGINAADLDEALRNEAQDVLFAIRQTPEASEDPDSTEPKPNPLLEAATAAVGYIDGVAKLEADGTIGFYRKEDVQQAEADGSVPVPIGSARQDSTFSTNRRTLYTEVGRLFEKNQIIDPHAAENAAAAERAEAEQAATAQAEAEAEASQAAERQAKLATAGLALRRMLKHNKLLIEVGDDDATHTIRDLDGDPVMKLKDMRPENALRALGLLAGLGFEKPEEPKS